MLWEDLSLGTLEAIDEDREALPLPDWEFFPFPFLTGRWWGLAGWTSWAWGRFLFLYGTGSGLVTRCSRSNSRFRLDDLEADVWVSKWSDEWEYSASAPPPSLGFLTTDGFCFFLTMMMAGSSLADPDIGGAIALVAI